MTTAPTLTELLERNARDAERERQRIRRLVAELAVLVEFDDNRRALGHDYGGGQRCAELSRRRGELTRLTAHSRDLDELDTYRPALRAVRVSDLRDALERIANPRMARIDREHHRRATPATRRTRQAWDRTVLAVDRVTGGPR